MYSSIKDHHFVWYLWYIFYILKLYFEKMSWSFAAISHTVTNQILPKVEKPLEFLYPKVCHLMLRYHWIANYLSVEIFSRIELILEICILKIWWLLSHDGLVFMIFLLLVKISCFMINYTLCFNSYMANFRMLTGFNCYQMYSFFSSILSYIFEIDKK